MTNPDAIIFGEQHFNIVHAKDQAKKIANIKPEFTLHEAYDQLEPKDLSQLLDLHRISTFKEYSERMAKIGVTQEDLGINKTLFRDLKRGSELDWAEKQKMTHKGLPSLAYNASQPLTYWGMLRTPFYHFGPHEMTSMLESLTINFASNAVDTIEQIRSGKLDHDLSRRKSGSVNLLVASMSEQFTPLYFGRSTPIVLSSIARSGSQLAGCDIDKGVPAEKLIHPTKEFLENPQKILEEMEKMDKDISLIIEEKNDLREETMGRRIADYSKKRKSDKPIIAIVGAGHAEDDSGIYPILDSEGVTYQTILQRPIKNIALSYTYKAMMMQARMAERNQE